MKPALTPQQCRDHKAMLLRNVRYHARHGCSEHATLLVKVFKHILNLRLPRVPRHKV